MRFNNLNDWLSWQESLNPKEIDLGLDRVRQVLSKLNFSSSFNCPLITVAGTNGKGSTVAFLESLAMAAGLNVCSYTSPHLLRYNERIKIKTKPVDDKSLCESFARLDTARGEIPLTYFEFGTLAAIELFFRQSPDLVILEVGLGGRLDAANVMDADLSIISSVAIDHTDWLGDDREKIGFEKAGIFRHGKPVICGDEKPPSSVYLHAEKLQCEFIQLGRDFKVNDKAETSLWSLESATVTLDELCLPALSGEFQKANAAVAIMALAVLSSKNRAASERLQLSRSISSQLVNEGLNTASLIGRFQKLRRLPDVYVDVAHNEQAAQALCSQLHDIRNKSIEESEATLAPKIWAIVAMLKDKDIVAVLDNVYQEVDHWFFCGLPEVERGLSVAEMMTKITASTEPMTAKLLIDVELLEQAVHDCERNKCTILNETVTLSNTVTIACESVFQRAHKQDKIIIFGSFFTVAEAMQYFQSNLKQAQ